jgi:hypothetical protein
MDELRRIESAVRRAQSIEELRPLFDRLQTLRRTFIDDFDVQVAIGQVQQVIVDQGRLLMENAGHAPTESAASLLEEGPERADDRLPHSHPSRDRHRDDVQPIDARSWKRSIYIGAIFAIILFALFFYLIQMARKLNIEPPQQASNGAQTGAQGQIKPVAGTPSGTVAPAGPSLRLYTDLVPGSVSVDGGPPQDLQDGQLELDTLKPGAHSVQLNGRSGDASFSFNVQDKTAPRVTGPPSGNNAMVVTVSTQDGSGQLMTNAQDATAIVDDKPAGAVTATGLALNDLGIIDHNLQIKRAHDEQRFILTYTPAPALTVFVKSDPNTGSLVVVAGEDGADVLLNGKPYRRKTERGELRIPSVKVGSYAVQVTKAGFIDPKPQTVQVKKGEEARLEFHLEPAPKFASLQVLGALPGTMILLDNNYAVSVGPDGSAAIANVKPGEHSVGLRHDGYDAKQVQRSFKAGATVTVAGPDVALAKTAAPPPPVPQPTAPAQANAAPPPEPVTIPGSLHKGGGFLLLHTPKGPGRYTFTLQLRKGGGFLKTKRLQWFVAFQDTKNYVLFQVDGKHFTVRRVENGKSNELQKLPFDPDPEDSIGVQISLKPNSVDTRLKSLNGSWQDMGPVTSPGSDFTQGKFGLLISGNDEVGVSTIHFSK